MPIYLDYNATAPVRPEVIKAMAEALEMPLNPSSVHRFGQEAKKRLESARKTLSEAISCFPAEIIFTGSATEANNTVLRMFADKRVLVSAIEHSSVINALPNAEIIPVTRAGLIDLAALEAMLTNAPPTQPSPVNGGGLKNSLPLLAGGGWRGEASTAALVSVMLANNETGVIQPVREAAEIAHKYGALFHCDAVQGLGKMPLDLGLLQADFVTLSAHKMGGPVGVGALFIRQGQGLEPLLKGGGQEGRKRAGTENLAAILGWQAALEVRDDWPSRNRRWHEGLESWLEREAPGMQVIGKNAPRLPNTSSLLMPGVPAETQLMHFDLSGFAVSAGSACSSGRIEPSHVLTTMGLGEEAAHVIRVSSGWATTEDDLIAFGEQWLTLWRRLGKQAS